MTPSTRVFSCGLNKLLWGLTQFTGPLCGYLDGTSDRRAYPAVFECEQSGDGASSGGWSATLSLTIGANVKYNSLVTASFSCAGWVLPPKVIRAAPCRAAKIM